MTKNRFFQGYCLNTGNSNSHFRAYEIITEREITDYQGGSIVESIKSAEDYWNDSEAVDEPFYTVYGKFKFDFVQSSFKIMTTDSLEYAINAIEHLSGCKVTEHYYHE